MYYPVLTHHIRFSSLCSRVIVKWLIKVLPRATRAAGIDRLRQAAIDKRKKEQRGAGRKVRGALSSLGRKFNKLTAQLDPELAAEGRITIEEEEEEEEVRDRANP